MSENWHYYWAKSMKLLKRRAIEWRLKWAGKYIRNKTKWKREREYRKEVKARKKEFVAVKEELKTNK